MWDKKLISGLSITKLCLKIEFPGQRNCTLTVNKAVNVTLTLTREWYNPSPLNIQWKKLREYKKSIKQLSYLCPLCFVCMRDVSK